MYNIQSVQYAPRPTPYGWGLCCPLAPLPNGRAFPGAGVLHDGSARKYLLTINTC